MHNAEPEKFYAQMDWILRGEGPETRQRDRAVTRKSANTRGRTSFCSRFDLFVPVRLLDETPVVLLLHILCLQQGYSLEWKISVRNWPIIGSQLHNFVLLVVPRLPSTPAAFYLQHREKRICPVISENWDHYQIQCRLVVTNMHAGNRC